MEDACAALKAAEELVRHLRAQPKPSPAEHIAQLEQVDKVRSLLETPLDVMDRQMDMLAVCGAMHTLIWTEAIDQVPQDGTISADELASKANMATSAVQRLMRVAISWGIFTEPAPDVYAHNDLSKAYRLSSMGPLFASRMNFTSVHLKLPEYFKTHAPEDLFDPKKSPWSWSNGLEGLTFWEAVDQDHPRRRLWNSAFALQRNVPVSGMFPWECLKGNVQAHPERPFIVDIGGGRGQALLAIQEQFPGAFGGKLILQDLPAVINSLSPADIPGIEPMAYDFFTPQPIQNAHVYFLRRVLHDFYPEECIKIIQNTAMAMGPESRLIISDCVLPNRVDAGRMQGLYRTDLFMMYISGKEKTAAEFEKILDCAGLELVKIWRSNVGAMAQVEARLKRSTNISQDRAQAP